MTAAIIIFMCAFSGLIGYSIGSSECDEYKASRYVEVLEDKLHDLEIKLHDSEINR